MSIKTPASDSDLLIVITRLHAVRGSSGDEFDEDWSPPARSDSGVIHGPDREHGYWAMSKDHKAGVVIVHGYDGLLSKSNGSFEDTIIRHLDTKGLRNYRFNCLTILKHGDVPELKSADASETEYSLFLEGCKKISTRFSGERRMYDYSLRGKRSAALEVPETLKTLRAKGIRIPAQVISLIEEMFNIGTAVELVVRSMQHIILEVRLWCDLYDDGVAKKTDANLANIQERLADCHKRLIDDQHWSNFHVHKAREFLCGDRSLDSYLDLPSLELFRQDEYLLKTSFQDLYEGYGGAEYLDCDENMRHALRPFLQNGELPKKVGEEAENFVDAGLRVLSARLEALIQAAVEVDVERRRKNGARDEAP